MFEHIILLGLIDLWDMFMHIILCENSNACSQYKHTSSGFFILFVFTFFSDNLVLKHKLNCLLK